MRAPWPATTPARMATTWMASPASPAWQSITRSCPPVPPAPRGPRLHDLIRYVQDELALGRLPNGKQLVSAENLLMRRAPQVSLGEDASYGMGLIVDRTYGVPVVSHGGSMSGFKSNLLLSAGLRHRRRAAHQFRYRRHASRSVQAPLAGGRFRRQTEGRRLTLPPMPRLTRQRLPKTANASSFPLRRRRWLVWPSIIPARNSATLPC